MSSATRYRRHPRRPKRLRSAWSEPAPAPSRLLPLWVRSPRLKVRFRLAIAVIKGVETSSAPRRMAWLRVRCSGSRPSRPWLNPASPRLRALRQLALDCDSMVQALALSAGGGRDASGAKSLPSAYLLPEARPLPTTGGGTWTHIQVGNAGGVIRPQRLEPWEF
jgi:hypothetical protein